MTGPYDPWSLESGLAFDKEGQPIGMHRWGKLSMDADYKRIGSDQVGVYLVSTVWLGINHSWTRQGPPIIFETMVFLAEIGQDGVPSVADEFSTDRYATEEQARQGHEDMLTLIRATTQLEPDEVEPTRLPDRPPA